MDTLFYKVVRPIVKILFYILFRPTVIGKENIPDSGALVLAGNHTKWLDPVFLVAVSKRQVHFLAKEELFHGITKFIVNGMGCISVNRKIHDKDALNNAKVGLNKKCCIGVFPEGTINRTDDIIMPFKKGAVKMSLENDCKILPFAINGKYKRGKLKIKFGDAYFPETNDIEKETKLLEQKVIKLIKECE